MYESYYGLSDKPFSMLPDPGYLFLSRKHETALTLLEYALMNSAGFCVITGEPGAGKTTLLRKLLESVGEDMAVGMITNTHKSFGELLDWVLSAFSIHEPGLKKVEKNQKFTDFLLEQYARGKTTLLIVDEAQNMQAETLEELRMLSNINSEKDQVLQVILAGQPQLKDTLRQPELMQFAQRIAVDYHLDALNLEETCGYIQHRLTVAGATNDVFTPKACEHIYQYSGGTPRLINLICDTALVYGFADHDDTLDENIIDHMVQERMRDSVVPLFKQVEQEAAPFEEQPQSAEDIDFPWINPQGGTKGLKPEAEAQANPEPAPEAETATESQAPSAEKKTEQEADQPELSVPEQSTSQQSTPEPTDPEPVAEQPADLFSQTLKLEPYRPTTNRWRWIVAGVAAVLLAVVSIVVVQQGDDAALAEKQRIMEQLERHQRMSSQLEDEVNRLRDRQQQQQAELEQQAEALQRERDEAIARAQQEAELRVERERQVEQIKQQITQTEASIKQEADKLVEQEKAKQQEITASKRKLEQELSAQRERLNQLVQELERSRQVSEVQASLQATELLPEETAAKPAEDDVDAEFNADPCSGPQARFVSRCR